MKSDAVFNVVAAARQDRRVVCLAGAIYGLSFQKYSVRNGLDQTPGYQGVLEALCVLLACSMVFFMARRTRTSPQLHPALIGLGLYGLIAFASSWRSFSLTLSLAKATVFGLALLMAYLVSQLRAIPSFVSGLYWSYLLTIAGGYALALTMPGRFPLTQIDEYSGRTQLTLWNTHPNALGETCGLLFLVAFLVPVGSRWYTQLALLGTALFAGEKTSAIALAVAAPILLWSAASTLRRFRVALFTGFWIASALMLVSLSFTRFSPALILGHAGTAIYGSQVGREASHFDGRTDVWKRALSATDECVLLGFGFDGSREFLLTGVSWGGHAHNGYIQTMLDAGITGAAVFLLSLGCLIAGAMTRRRDWNARICALALYLLLVAVTAPIFDSTSYVSEVILVSVLYFGLQQKEAEKPLPARQKLYPELRVA